MQSLSAQSVGNCGFWGHSKSDFISAYGSVPLLGYQVCLFAKLDEVIHTGYLSFVTFLGSGVNNWLASYVLMQRNGYPDAGIRLSLLIPQNLHYVPTIEESELLQHADKLIPVVLDTPDDSLRLLLEHCTSLFVAGFPQEERRVVNMAKKRSIPCVVVSPSNICTLCINAK